MISRVLYREGTHITDIGVQNNDIIIQTGSSGTYVLTIKASERSALIKLLAEMQLEKDSVLHGLEGVEVPNELKKPLRYLIDQDTLDSPSDYAILTAFCELFSSTIEDPFNRIEALMVEKGLSKPASYWT